MAGFVFGLVAGYYAAPLFHAENMQGLFSVAAAMVAAGITHIVYKRCSGTAVKKLPLITEVIYG